MALEPAWEFLKMGDSYHCASCGIGAYAAKFVLDSDGETLMDPPMCSKCGLDLGGSRR